MTQNAIDCDALVEQLLEDSADRQSQIAQLPAPEVAELVEHLKAEADRHWWINANRSLELAELIVRVGQARGDVAQIALGTMARADALRFLGRIESAWSLLETAGE